MTAWTQIYTGEVGTISRKLKTEEASGYVEGPCHTYGRSAIKYFGKNVAEPKIRLLIDLAYLEDKAHSFWLSKHSGLERKLYSRSRRYSSIALLQ